MAPADPNTGSSASQIATDAPVLLPLARSHPHIPIFTASHPAFTVLHCLTQAIGAEPPLAVARPMTEADVATTVRFCSAADVPLAVRAGGNDMFGRSRAGAGGLSLDMRALSNVAVAPGRATVTVGGGVLTGDLVRALDVDGLTTPTPFSAIVGYVGWACGGGYGVLAGVHGMGADQIVSGRVVLAPGEVVEAAEDKDKELLWALRGGGAGVLGVVAALTVRVYPRPRCLAGSVVYPLAEAPTVFEALARQVGESWPDAFAGEMMVVNPPGSGGLLSLLFFWALKEDGSDEPGAREYLERVARFGTVVANTVKEATPLEFLEFFPNPDLRHSRAYTVRTCSVPMWSAELGRLLSRTPLPSAVSAIVIHACHGAATRPRLDACFFNRQPHLLLGISGAADTGDPEAALLAEEWAVGLHEAISGAGLTMWSEYINFSPPQKNSGLKFYGEEGAGRMRELKLILDPGAVFAKSTPDLGEVAE